MDTPIPATGMHYGLGRTRLMVARQRSPCTSPSAPRTPSAAGLITSRIVLSYIGQLDRPAGPAADPPYTLVHISTYPSAYIVTESLTVRKGQGAHAPSVTSFRVLEARAARQLGQWPRFSPALHPIYIAFFPYQPLTRSGRPIRYSGNAGTAGRARHMTGM